MKFKLIVCTLSMILSVSSAWAIRGRIATDEDIILLKKDILEGRVQTGSTRLKQIRRAYGEPKNILETKKKLTFDYGDLKIEFDKFKYFRDWEYDYSHDTAYKDEIDDLRFDLEDGQIVGDFHRYEEILKDYEDPTESFETYEDGALSIYYWGELKLTFENFIVIRSIKGKKLGDTIASEGVLLGK